MELMVIKNFSNAKGSFNFGDIIKCTPEEAKLLKEQRLVKEYREIIVAIDEEIINELGSLFMAIY